MSPIWLIVVLLVLLALLLTVSAVGAFRKRRVMGGAVASLVAVLLVAVAAAAGAAAWSLAGFEALTRETVAATVRIETDPDQTDAFDAHVRFASGEERTFRLAGDQVVVEAQIVKWHPWAHMAGLTTAYRLDRIAGRYRDLDAERTRPRTVESLSEELPPFAATLFRAAEGRSWLEPLVDARYGSGTFVAADADDLVEVRVSTSGLLMRSVTP